MGVIGYIMSVYLFSHRLERGDVLFSYLPRRRLLLLALEVAGAEEGVAVGAIVLVMSKISLQTWHCSAPWNCPFASLPRFWTIFSTVGSCL